ncbi:MAG: hypothetical protein AAGA23_07180 [Pseudomonadota bacterium]
MTLRQHSLAAALLALASLPAFAQDALSNGQLRERPDGSFQAWHQASETWVTPFEFWDRFAASRGGLTWGWGAEYPPYAQVKELDLFLVELPSGPCLMEFFHTRWRRANDVRRWDTRFNKLGGCANVFD